MSEESEDESSMRFVPGKSWSTDQSSSGIIDASESSTSSFIEESNNGISEDSSDENENDSYESIPPRKNSEIIEDEIAESLIDESNQSSKSKTVSPDPTKVIGCSSASEISHEKIASALQHISKDDLHGDLISTRRSKERISEQFRFNSEGILNSTAFHPADQNRMWRLSNNFNHIREVEEVLPDPSVEILSDHESDIIEVSSNEETSPKRSPLKPLKLKKAVHQQTLHSFIVKKENTTPQRQKKHLSPIEQTTPLAELLPSNGESSKVIVSLAEYESQQNKVASLEMDYAKLLSMTEKINFEALPDKGLLVQERLRMAEYRFKHEKQKLEEMVVSNSKVDDAPKGAFANVAWEDIEAGANAVLPKTFGKTAMSTYNAQRAVTLDRLQQLHEALQTCPKEQDFEDDPKGIKVPLMPHQKHALAWVMFREKERPSGGILADDMGLGKTLTMLSLIVKSLQLEKQDDSDDDSDEENKYMGKHTKYNGGSLIICPASLINQWSGEIDRHLKRGLVSYVLHHGPKRETRVRKLAEYDIVITTYAIIKSEAEKLSSKIKWRRIILDEAHTIRNYKTKTCEACCQLLAQSRWALTGTPLHNKTLDMYALLKFLRCSPFDDLQVWKRWVEDKSTGGTERLHTVISSLMLRRTKVELMEKGALNCMPEKTWKLINVKLDETEMRVYHKVMIFSRTLFAQFLHQRAEKNQDYIEQKFTDVAGQAPNQEYFKMRQKLMKINKVKDVSQHEILVLLLRLRQICCHPSLITAMLDDSIEDVGEGDDECDQLNLLEQLEKLNIEDDDADDEHKPDHSLSAMAQGISQDDKISLKQASKGHLHPSDPVFAEKRISSKIKAMLLVLQDNVLAKDEKAIIVSQWSSYLKLVAMHLKDRGIEYDQLDGNVPVNKRMNMVDRLNNPQDKLQVLLLSLTAGGVGLNLVGANHLFLLDLHWNPQLENQAQDRIYRVGQTKPVYVYKFMAADTIEERIKALQDQKLGMAEGLLMGTKQVTQSKLSLQDLRMIFGM